uniref:Uncharacterized protein n=1 Tax=Nothobranchius furzeri TaxID=105023 RepID=A0A8C6PBS3_NOTFU
MEVPFTGFELTFIVLAFVIFTLFSLASVCLQPQDLPSGTRLSTNQERSKHSPCTTCVWRSQLSELGFNKPSDSWPLAGWHPNAWRLLPVEFAP